MGKISWLQSERLTVAYDFQGRAAFVLAARRLASESDEVKGPLRAVAVWHSVPCSPRRTFFRNLVTCVSQA
jgi:hypothetical protein